MDLLQTNAHRTHQLKYSSAELIRQMDDNPGQNSLKPRKHLNLDPYPEERQGLGSGRKAGGEAPRRTPADTPLQRTRGVCPPRAPVLRGTPAVCRRGRRPRPTALGKSRPHCGPDGAAGAAGACRTGTGRGTARRDTKLPQSVRLRTAGPAPAAPRRAPYLRPNSGGPSRGGSASASAGSLQPPRPRRAAPLRRPPRPGRSRPEPPAAPPPTPLPGPSGAGSGSAGRPPSSPPRGRAFPTGRAAAPGRAEALIGADSSHSAPREGGLGAGLPLSSPGASSG
ncbi:proline-rich protein 2-like [Lathamus discolor]|uniref:proline-rich protein 2-like n=1 Tax=Lathamus discolor TaxID=678569 RepID=UPI0032B72EEF